MPLNINHVTESITKTDGSDPNSWTNTSFNNGDKSGAVVIDAISGHLQEMTVTAAVTSLTVNNLNNKYPRIELLVVNTSGHAFAFGSGWNEFGTIPEGNAVFRIVLAVRADGTTKDAIIGTGNNL
jgi:hypothetical protein